MPLLVLPNGGLGENLSKTRNSKTFVPRGDIQNVETQAGCHIRRHVSIWEKLFQFSSRWYLCARKSPYELHHVSQKFPQVLRSYTKC